MTESNPTAPPATKTSPLRRLRLPAALVLLVVAILIFRKKGDGGGGGGGWEDGSAGMWTESGDGYAGAMMPTSAGYEQGGYNQGGYDQGAGYDQSAGYDQNYGNY